MERVYIKRSFGEHDRVADAGPPPNTLPEHHQSTAERESVTQKLLVLDSIFPVLYPRIRMASHRTKALKGKNSQLNLVDQELFPL